MNEIEYERMQEDAAIGDKIAANLKGVLDSYGVEDLRQLERTVYKHTECGAALSVILMSGARAYEHLDKVPLSDVRGFVVSSIVEGVEETTGTYEVELGTYDWPEDAVNGFGEAVSAVEEEARSIWNATHGCKECAKLWHREDVYTNEYGDEFEGGDGVTPVHPDCPECGGHGTII